MVEVIHKSIRTPEGTFTPAQKRRHKRLRALAEADPNAPSVRHKNDPATQGDKWQIQFAMKELKELRLAHGLTQEQLAAKAGITTSQISRLENGRRPNPTWATLSRLACALGRSLDLNVVPQVPRDTGKPSGAKLAAKTKPGAAARKRRPKSAAAHADG